MKTQKGFVSILVIILVLLILGVGIYIYLNTEKNDEAVGNSSVVDFDIAENTDVVDSVNYATKEVVTPKNTSLNEEVSVEDPFVNIISPSGGETWEQDSEYVVSWTQGGLLKEDKINIGFRSSDGQTMCWLESVSVGLGSFKVIPEEINCNGVLGLEGEYKFQIIVDKYAEGKGVADMSDDFFTIK